MGGGWKRVKGFWGWDGRADGVCRGEGRGLS